MRLLFTAFSIVFVALGYSQNFSSFVLGKNQLSNTDVYSILLTHNNDLYLTSNQGILKFRYNKFTPVWYDGKQKGLSAFSLTQDDNNRIFCCNLKGQIFEIKNDSAFLFCEIPKEHISDISQLEFTSDNHLIFASKGFFRVEKGKYHLLYKNQSSRHTLTKLPNKKLIGAINIKDSIISFQNNGYQLQKINVNRNYKNNGAYAFDSFFSLSNQLIYLHNKTFSGDLKTVSSIPFIEKESYYQYNEDELWARSYKKGIRKIYLENDTLKTSNTYFPNTFFSAITSDKDGALYLGTFGNGIYVIPSQNTIEHHLSNNQNKLKSIVTVNNDILLLNDNTGIIKYSNYHPPKVLVSSNESNTSKLIRVDDVNLNILNPFPSVFHELDSKAPIKAVKDICVTNTNEIIYATSRGIFTYQKENFTNNKKWKKNETYYSFDRAAERCQAVVFHNNYIYAAYTSGLIKIDAHGNYSEITYNNNTVLCSDMIIINDNIYCSTQNNGIIILSDTIKKLEKTENKKIRKIRLINNYLIYLSQEGFYAYHLKNNTTRLLGLVEGITGYVTDFDVSNNMLWVIIDRSKLLSVNLSLFSQNPPSVNISIDSILVNGNIKKRTELINLHHTENQFSFFVKNNDIKQQKESVISYRLIGLDSTWNKLKNSYTIEYKALPYGNYSLEIIGKYGESLSEKETLSIHIQAPYWQTWWFYLLISLGLLLIIVISFLIRIKWIKRKNKEKLEKQKLQTDLIDSELKALRSQMNPHFIFNSLNSIQDLILQQDTDASYDYIVLFAQLVRNTLNYSNQDFIPLEKEIEFLDIYLKLEQLRFGDDFSYSIICSDVDGINIPSLLIQPFIENALIHGLLHKSGAKKLTIAFKLKNKQLICTITDNGVGREESKKIQQRQGKPHESFALKAIEKRLYILKNQYGDDIGYEIIDLKDESIAKGTKVIINMPYHSHF